MKTVKKMFISTLAVLLVVGFATVNPSSAYASQYPINIVGAGYSIR